MGETLILCLRFYLVFGFLSPNLVLLNNAMRQSYLVLRVVHVLAMLADSVRLLRVRGSGQFAQPLQLIGVTMKFHPWMECDGREVEQPILRIWSGIKTGPIRNPRGCPETDEI
jgi:hypothetical protein